jgi:hypothetical protein
MAYEHIRANFTTVERDIMIQLLDQRLTELSVDFGSCEFADLFRIRDRLSRCTTYRQSQASSKQPKGARLLTEADASHPPRKEPTND